MDLKKILKSILKLVLKQLSYTLKNTCRHSFWKYSLVAFSVKNKNISLVIARILKWSSLFESDP